MLTIYKDYDIYISASRFDNYPFSLLEAMAAAISGLLVTIIPE